MMERSEAVRRVMGYVDIVRTATCKDREADAEFAFEVADVFMALGITGDDVNNAKDRKCGAVNPRTGMVCNIMPHSSDKHWTLNEEDGQRYDWFMNADHE